MEKKIVTFDYLSANSNDTSPCVLVLEDSWNKISNVPDGFFGFNINLWTERMRRILSYYLLVGANSTSYETLVQIVSNNPFCTSEELSLFKQSFRHYKFASMSNLKTLVTTNLSYSN